MSPNPKVRAVLDLTPVPPLRFDPTLPDPLRQRLQTQFTSARTPAFHLTTLPAVAPVRETPTVAFFDGKLGPDHAPLLKGPRPVLLCALRDNGLPSAWELELLSAVIHGQGIPGFGAGWHHQRIGSVAQIGDAADTASAVAGRVGANGAVGKLASDVTHELLANALLDAPVDRSGAERYARRRDASPVIAAEDACTFGVAANEHRIVVAASDRFGRLTSAPVARALEGYGARVQPDTSGGGAGLGMRLILEHCDAVVFRVAPGVSTEAVGILELNGPRRRAAQPKSVFFLQTAPEARGGTA